MKLRPSDSTKKMYKPRLNDYVKWNKGNHSIEGWVYYVDQQYITIETKVIPKPEEDIPNGTTHKNNRCLVLCHPEYYHQLEYVTHREHVHAEPTTYKSQTYRDRDLY